MFKHADSKHWGCKFEYYTRQNENAITEEGSGKPSLELHFPIKEVIALPLVSATLELKCAVQIAAGIDDVVG